jgi:LSD1 subclass zinc finger protein
MLVVSPFQVTIYKLYPHFLSPIRNLYPSSPLFSCHLLKLHPFCCWFLKWGKSNNITCLTFSDLVGVSFFFFCMEHRFTMGRIIISSHWPTNIFYVCNAGLEMAQLICGGCRTLLMYTRNADTVRCSCCHTVNLVRPGIAGSFPIFLPALSLVLLSLSFFIEWWIRLYYIWSL